MAKYKSDSCNDCENGEVSNCQACVDGLILGFIEKEKRYKNKIKKLKLFNAALFKCYCGDYDSLTEEQKKLLPEV